MSMNGRESGMPDEAYWDSFFQPEGILDRLLLSQGGWFGAEIEKAPVATDALI